MKKILVAFGTRPEAIKLAPVIKRLSQEPKVEVIATSTGQHQSMLDQVLKIFSIKPQFDLKLMKPNQKLTTLMGEALHGIQKVLEEAKPDVVMVQGDTLTSFAIASAAFLNEIPVAHVEAGLRTYDFRHPFPEEGLRRLTGVVTSFHFAPTKKSKENLLSERVDPKKIWVTGNTVVDALREMHDTLMTEDVKKRSHELTQGKPHILVTSHRRESWGEGLEQILKAIKLVAESNPQLQVIFPAHLNPNVGGKVREILGQTKNCVITEPQDYALFLNLLKTCLFTISDSGGVQEEAAALGKKVLITRLTTERPEVVECGQGILVGMDTERIVNEASYLLKTGGSSNSSSLQKNPIGDGRASERITQVLLKGSCVELG